MPSHKPTDFDARYYLQGLQPPNFRVTGVHLGATVYERKQGVMRMIGWRLRYFVSELEMEFGEAVEKSTVRIESVFIK